MKENDDYKKKKKKDKDKEKKFEKLKKKKVKEKSKSKKENKIVVEKSNNAIEKESKAFNKEDEGKKDAKKHLKRDAKDIKENKKEMNRYDNKREDEDVKEKRKLEKKRKKEIKKKEKDEKKKKGEKQNLRENKVDEDKMHTKDIKSNQKQVSENNLEKSGGLNLDVDVEGSRRSRIEQVRGWSRRVSEKRTLKNNPPLRIFLSEFLATLIFVFIANGSLSQVLIGRNLVGINAQIPNQGMDPTDYNYLMFGNILCIALVNGIGFALAIAISGDFCGFVNPAITLAMAIFNQIRWNLMPFYWLGQYIGAFIGGILVFSVHGELLDEIDAEKTNKTSQIFASAPNFQFLGTFSLIWDQVWGTALLTIFIFGISDSKNQLSKKSSKPFYAGSALTALILVTGISTGTILNPARDFMPRIFAFLIGYEDVFSENDSFFWMPLILPHFGAIFGALLYLICVGWLRPDPDEDEVEKQLVDPRRRDFLDERLFVSEQPVLSMEAGTRFESAFVSETPPKQDEEDAGSRFDTVLAMETSPKSASKAVQVEKQKIEPKKKLKVEERKSKRRGKDLEENHQEKQKSGRYKEELDEGHQDQDVQVDDNYYGQFGQGYDYDYYGGGYDPYFDDEYYGNDGCYYEPYYGDMHDSETQANQTDPSKEDMKKQARDRAPQQPFDYSIEKLKSHPLV